MGDSNRTARAVKSGTDNGEESWHSGREPPASCIGALPSGLEHSPGANEPVHTERGPGRRSIAERVHWTEVGVCVEPELMMHTELTGSSRSCPIGRLDSRSVDYVHDHDKTRVSSLPFRPTTDSPSATRPGSPTIVLPMR